MDTSYKVCIWLGPEEKKNQFLKDRNATDSRYSLNPCMQEPQQTQIASSIKHGEVNCVVEQNGAGLRDSRLLYANHTDPIKSEVVPNI